MIKLQERFVRETKISELQENEKMLELLKGINESKNTRRNMYHKMRVAEDDMIDYYTYQIKAEEAKYNYLIKQVKKAELKKK